MSDYIDVKVVAQVIATGLLLGAGLPLIFSLGVRALSTGTEASGTGGFVATKSPAALATAAVCGIVVLGAIAFGIFIIVNKS